MKPLIAVVANTAQIKTGNRFGVLANNISVNYTEAVEKAGGLAMILPFTQKLDIIPLLVEKADGFLFTGGIDVDPAYYDEKGISGLGSVSTELDRFQMTVFHAVMSCRKPILGICRGIQLINVALDGSLFQDIPSQFSAPTLKHMQDELSFEVDHPITIAPGSRLFDLFGSTIMVNSRHHQSIKAIGRDLIITARAPDGVIEAAEHKTLPMDLVQWHPELMLRKNDDMLCLFESFINRC